MKRPAFIVAAAAFIVLQASGASAQATRTWVSGVGDDVNPCSRTAPCKTFAGAISKTADGGIIDMLDPGGFGSVTITKGITIRGTAEGGGTLASSTNGFVVNAPGKVVQLVNLQIDGSATTPASSGIAGVRVLAASWVTIDNCVIQGFRRPETGFGLQLAAAAPTRVSITNSRIYNNRIGVDIAPPADKTNSVTLDRVFIDNTETAIRAAGATARLIARGVTALDAFQFSGGAELRSYGDNAFRENVTPTVNVPLR